MRLTATSQAWERWQAAAGWWKGWSVCPALLAPGTVDVEPGSGKRPAALDIATTLATTLEQGGVLVAVNLDPALGVNVAAQLNEWQLANAVLVLPRWPYRQALLPVDELVDALVGQADKLSRDTDMDNVVFVLDNQRTRSVAGRRKSDVRADNRYQLTVADLPGLTALRTRRIRRIVMLSAT